MASLQGLFRNLKEHEIKLKRFPRNDDNRKKKSLALKAITSFDDDEDELESIKD